MKKAKKTSYIYAKGRRKSASARVRLIKGKGENLVNSKPYEEYFPGFAGRALLEKLFKSINTDKEKYYVTVRVVGGGKSGQLDAVIHAIAKAFVSLNKEEFKLSLKKAGFLKRDARIRERRKVGMGGKARRKKQSPKR